jgi:5-methylcytosine-specific restriction endonuclease McrA
MVRLYMAEKVEVVEYSPRVIRSAQFSVMVPSVARLKRYIDMPEVHRSVLLTTKAVMARDQYQCAYCGKENLGPIDGTMDHIQPRAKGGSHNWRNVTAACRSCNAQKKDHTLEEMLVMGPDKPNVPGAVDAWVKRWTLTRHPFVPTGVTAYLLAQKPFPEWLPYLGVEAVA